jgi:glutamate transport system substrate-binding protein
MSTRRILTVATSAVMLLGLAACGSSASSSTEPTVAASATFAEGTTMARLAKAGTITVGTKFDQPLFGLKGLDNKPAGFDVEIAKIIAGELGIGTDKIRWIETPTKVRDEAVSTGKVDVAVATYTINESRKERVTFAGPYYKAGTELMVKSDSPITGTESLNKPDLKVCTATGASYIDAVTKFLASHDQLVQFDVYSKCADALRTGQVNAVAADSSILLGIVSNTKDKVKIVGDSFYDQYFGIGIRKGDLPFCEFINETLTKAVQDGRYKTAWEKTGGTVTPEVPPLPELAKCA